MELFLLYMIFIIILSLAFSIVWVAVCYAVAKNRQLPTSYMWFGLLGVIGLVILLCQNPRTEQPPPVYQSYAPPQPTYAPSAPAAPNVSEELLRWKQLLDSGAITQKEYDRQKARLLSSAQYQNHH